MHQQHEHPLGASQKCRIPDPTLDPLSQNLHCNKIVSKDSLKIEKLSLGLIQKLGVGPKPQAIWEGHCKFLNRVTACSL